MKKKLIITMLLLGANAQALVVFDPSVNAQLASNQAQNFAKTIEQIQNQVQQINQLRQQIEQVKSVNDAINLTNNTLGKFGNNPLNEISGLQNSFESMKGLGNASTLSDLTNKLKSAGSVLNYSGAGGSSSIFTNAPLSTEQTQRFGTMQTVYDNYKQVQEKNKVQRTKLANDYVRAREAAARATNDADRQAAEAQAKAAKDGMEEIDATTSEASDAVKTTAAVQDSEDKKKVEAAKAEMTKRENEEFNQWLEKDKEAQKKLWGN